MNLQDVFSDRTLKSKQKTDCVIKWLLANPKQMNELIAFAKDAKDPLKVACIEAIEFISKTQPEIVTATCFNFVIATLSEKAPRVKWESARVIGNSVHLHSNKLEKAIQHLLVNSEHTGTVVRWSAAYALGEIVKLKTTVNKDLIPAIEAVCKREEKNSIKKIYVEALKKLKN